MGHVDLHSHVLPGLDDGVKALAEAIEVIDLLQKMGFTQVCATPHQKAGFFMPTREAIDAAHAQVSQALLAQGSPLELLLGAENFWDDVLLQRMTTRSQPRYTGARAFLFEVNVQVAPPRLEDQLFHVRLQGILPVIAHPERYMSFWDRNFSRYEALARTAALVVDLGALDGAHGQKQCVHARKLVEEGLAHAAATDVHSTVDARAAAQGIAWLRKRLGERAVTRLLDEHPRRILNGELPD